MTSIPATWTGPARVAGTSKYPIDWLSIVPGDKLLLVREPRNQWDPQAIAVYHHISGIIGYLERDTAAGLAPKMDSGLEASATITEKTGGGTGADGRRLDYGINISIELTEHVPLIVPHFGGPTK